jgi:hypothetical protein
MSLETEDINPVSRALQREWITASICRCLKGVHAEVHAALEAASSAHPHTSPFLVTYTPLPVELRFRISGFVAWNAVVALVVAGPPAPSLKEWWTAAGHGRELLPLLPHLPSARGCLEAASPESPCDALLTCYAAHVRWMGPETGDC